MGRHVCIFGKVENWVLSISFAPAVGGSPEINHCRYNRTKTDTLAKGQYHARACANIPESGMPRARGAGAIPHFCFGDLCFGP